MGNLDNGYQIGCGIGRQVEEAVGVTWRNSDRSSPTVVHY